MKNKILAPFVGRIHNLSGRLLVILSVISGGVMCAPASFSQTSQTSLSSLLTEGHDPQWRDSIVNAALQDARVEGAKVGFYVEDLRTGEVLADVNGDMPLVPASVTKSVTVATALSLHNPSERFATEVVAKGEVEGSTLCGDLIIYTVGDPTIESSFFPDYHGFADSIAKSLEALGITAIEGKVMIDDSMLEDEPLPSGWLNSDIMHAYGTGHHSANFADNTLTLRIPSKLTVPATPGMKITYGSKKGKLRTDRKRNSKEVVVSGRVPKKGASISMSNPAPESSMTSAVETALKKSGIEIKKLPGKSTAGDEEIVVYTHLSPTLLEIARSLMHRSDNMMAEAMLRYLAPGQKRDDAIKKELDFWQARTVDMTGIVIEDGSGLSRSNRITPYFLADINYMMSQDALLSQDFASLFPKAGKEGTMKNTLKNTRLEGRLALKTGTVNGVRTLSGYLLDGDGTPSHVVVIMVNDFKCSRGALKSWIESLLLKILP